MYGRSQSDDEAVPTTEGQITYFEIIVSNVPESERVPLNVPSKTSLENDKDNNQ